MFAREFSQFASTVSLLTLLCFIASTNILATSQSLAVSYCHTVTSSSVLLSVINLASDFAILRSIPRLYNTNLFSSITVVMAVVRWLKLPIEIVQS